MIGLIRAQAPAILCGQVEALRFPLWDVPPSDATYALRWHEGHLELMPLYEKGSIWVDFVGGALAHRRKFGGGRGQPVAKAVGIKGDYLPRVLDCTAGQGRDAFVLASLGCEVVMLERSPVAFLLLQDGLRRAQEDAETATIATRMSLIRADAREWLDAAVQAQPSSVAVSPPHLPSPNEGASFDVVYLDPMFPEPDKRAKSKKEMSAFQTLIGGDLDADALLALARKLAGKRVIVKRPRHAPWLAGEKPNFVFEGESTRFDGYLPTQ
ncbi:16S rRNA (guanine1516-N2)-methyltransferase [Formivibrio citricus]|uniref:Ribosomal RNA small subunit methyltransferase J n=1 Tax=Formivibrio citricus TaxID=83765 RepID=A0A1I5BJF7_9NEIS|nr:class I SAM-dependent methyltransferase [Formivibrio citricus]SFN74898.1 16S rRNA (guanine1516-N2)-methyltransferase [Formivibrio citricus]